MPSGARKSSPGGLGAGVAPSTNGSAGPCRTAAISSVSCACPPGRPGAANAAPVPTPRGGTWPLTTLRNARTAHFGPSGRSFAAAPEHTFEVARAPGASRRNSLARAYGLCLSVCSVFSLLALSPRQLRSLQNPKRASAAYISDFGVGGSGRSPLECQFGVSGFARQGR